MATGTPDEVLARLDRLRRRRIAGYKGRLARLERRLDADNARRVRHGLQTWASTVEIDGLRGKIQVEELLADRPLFGWGG